MADKSNLSIQGYNLLTLLKRLEAATSRLEDVTIFQEQAVTSSSTTTKDITTESGEVSSSTVAPPPPTETKPNVEEDAPFVKEYDRFLDEYVAPFTEASQQLVPEIKETAAAVDGAFTQLRSFLVLVSKASKPSPTSTAFATSLTPINKFIEVIIAAKDKNRTSKYFNHLSTIAEGIPALGWVCTEKPVPFINDYKDASQFYANRVIKEYRTTDQQQVKWTQAFLQIFNGLAAYVKQYHTTGPSWNPKGETLETFLSTSTAAPAAAPPPAGGASGPPPPPPPMPPSSTFNVSKDTSSTSAGIGAVFAELNKGEAITSSLKKVEKSQMTHKNPSLRGHGSVSGSSAKQHPVPPKKPNSLSKKKKPARKELLDTKWFVENFENEEVTIEGEMSHGVFIENCSGCTVIIKGKVNAISVSNCTKVGLLVESLVSGIDIIKCKKFGIQATGKLPLITVDGSDGGEIYLNPESIDTEIFTSNSTALNVDIPGSDGDFEETPLPEQLKHEIVNGKLVTSVVEHSG